MPWLELKALMVRQVKKTVLNAGTIFRKYGRNWVALPGVFFANQYKNKKAIDFVGGSVTENEMQTVAALAATKAVQETLRSIGIDATNVLASQQDFAHLRKQRVASEQVGEWTRRAMVASVITGAIAIFITGIQHFKF